MDSIVEMSTAFVLFLDVTEGIATQFGLPEGKLYRHQVGALVILFSPAKSRRGTNFSAQSAQYGGILTHNPVKFLFAS